MTISADTAKQNFHGIRLFLWPIHRHELKKLFPMLFIFFLVSFDYNILRTMKDTIVIYAPNSGAEVLPFLKVWAMFPGTLLMTFLFTRLSNKYARQKVTYILMSVFLLYFFFFVAFAYPYRNLLEPTTLTTHLQQILPTSFKWLILVFSQNWISTSFYVMSELWSNIIFFVLFWGFVNQITRLSEAKRFYGILGVGANLSGIFAGQVSVYLSSLAFNPAIPYGENQWDQSVLFLISLVIAAGLAVLLLFRWMHKNILNDPIYYDPAEAQAEGRTQGKLSMREAFSYLCRSKYLVGVAAIVISYNIVINLVEVIWKHEVHVLYNTQSAYNVYMNEVSTIIAVIATLSALFVSGNAIRKFGWTITAMLTPSILMITSLAFFSFFFLMEYFPEADIFFAGLTPLAIVVFAGTSQNIVCRAAKYSIFDATKEMAFVPLSSECKLKGKAAIDGVCSRLGKAGGSFIHQTLLLSLDSFTQCAPYVAGLLFGVIGLWMAAVRTVGSKFSSLNSNSTSPTQPILTEEEPTASLPSTQEELQEQQVAMPRAVMN